MNKKSYAVLIVLLMAILSITLQFNNKIENINSMMSNVNNQFASLANNVHKMIYTIDQEVEKSRLVQKMVIDIENIDPLYKEALINIDMTFNKIGEDADVKFYYRSEKLENENKRFLMRESITESYKSRSINETIYGDWKEIQMAKTNAMNYIAQFQLSYEYNYQTKIVVNYNDEFITEETNKINLFYDSLPQCWVNVRTSKAISTGDLTYFAEINFYYQKNDIDLESVYIKAYNGDILIDEFELLDKNYDFSNHPDYCYNADKETTFEVLDKFNFDDYIHYEAIVKDSLGRTFIFYDNY